MEYLRPSVFLRGIYAVSGRLRTAADSVLSYISGGTECVCCGSPCLRVPLCARCRRKLFSYVPFSGGYRCRICGKELISEQSVCMECRTVQLIKHTAAVFPIHRYRLWRKELVFKWKMEGVRTLSPLFAELAHDALVSIERILDTADIPLVPVPPRPGKIRTAGWDQIRDLCRFLNHRWGHRVLPLLERCSAEQQKKLGREERLSRLNTAYRLSRRCTVLRENRRMPEHVIVIDDLMTTGATVEACAALLAGAGVRSIYALVLFTDD